MSTTEWKKLDMFYLDSALWEALRAARLGLDEQANLLGIANEKWGQAIARAEAAEARVRKLEESSKQWTTTCMRCKEGWDDAEKAEASLKVAVEFAQTVRRRIDEDGGLHGPPCGCVRCDLDRALAKLREGEP